MDIGLALQIAIVQGTAQGLANTANGLQDSAIGLANVAIWLGNTGPGTMPMAPPREFTPVNQMQLQYIASPDWSYGLYADESRVAHEISKMLGATSAEYLGGVGMTKLFMVVKQGKNAKQVATCLQDAAGELGEQVAKNADDLITPTGQTYSVGFQTELKATSYPGSSRAAHFQEANKNLLTMMEKDVQFTRMVQDMGVNLQRTATGLAPRTPPFGWTWHHDVESGVMQLVPRVQHTSGSIFWETMHPAGKGGYFLWGK